MADVIGSCSTLPGALHSVPRGAKCDRCGKPATVRKQGETDSFGAELYDLCDECASAEPPPWYKDPAATCEWCEQPAGEYGLRPRRDPDEGMGGPVYYVCWSCIEKQDAYWEAEARRLDDLYGEWVE